jgi:hypothetical protein
LLEQKKNRAPPFVCANIFLSCTAAAATQQQQQQQQQQPDKLCTEYKCTASL